MNTEISEASLIELETYADKLYDHNGNHIDVVTELAANDSKRINWKHWLSLPHWKPREAVFLLNLYDPKKTPANPARKIDLDEITVLAKREQRAGILPPRVSPIAWVAWAEEKGIRVPTQFAGLGAWTEAASAPEAAPAPKKLVSKAQQQQNEILRIIENVLFLKPCELPRVKIGQAGTKAEVRKKLVIPSELFLSVKVFDTAWQRLRGMDMVKEIE